MQPELIEIDLSKTTKHGGAGLETDRTYLVLYDGRLYTGRFYEVWYGLSFHGIYEAGAQYDPPDTNYSSWQRIWEIVNSEVIAKVDELDYAQRRRAYAISHGLHSNGQRIDETSPIEAFLYRPTAPAMPKRDEDEDEDDEYER